MKRRDLLKKIRQAAKAHGASYEEFEMTRHTGVVVGDTRTTVARHNEIQDRMAVVIFKQLEQELGEGWWR